jgi:hypothetical protein
MGAEMNQDLKKNDQHGVAYPSISLTDFIADLLGWKDTSKTTKKTSRDKALRSKARANAKPTLIGKA